MRGLTKRFGAATAIRDVSFEVQRGEIVGFLGPNGAGKSTTLRILSGLVPATSGEAWVAGVSVARDPHEVKRRIGYMPENNPLPEDMRVVEYLRHRARIKELPRGRRRGRVDEVMELCDLHRKARRKLIGVLSKGYRQRVGIADAILSEPEVVIMDEPTIGLDPHQILIIRRLIDALRGKVTLILSSHILAEVEISCDRVLILNQGRLVASGSRDTLRREFISGNRYALEFAGALETLHSALRGLDPAMEVGEGTKSPCGDFMRHTLRSNQVEDLSEALLTGLSRSSGLRIRAFHRLEPTLEDVFLAATRRSWEQEQEAFVERAGVGRTEGR